MGKCYAELALNLMKVLPPSPARDRVLKRLADSCDDAMPVLKKIRQSNRNSTSGATVRRQRDG